MHNCTLVKDIVAPCKDFGSWLQHILFMIHLIECGACSPAMARFHYILWHVYAKFVLHMDHNYMSTPSWFDGPNRGHSYEYPETHRDYLRTRRDPTTIPTFPRLVPLPRRSIVLP